MIDTIKPLLEISPLSGRGVKIKPGVGAPGLFFCALNREVVEVIRQRNFGRNADVVDDSDAAFGRRNFLHKIIVGVDARKQKLFVEVSALEVKQQFFEQFFIKQQFVEQFFVEQQFIIFKQ